MIRYDVSRICPGHHFSVSGVSYIGAPVSGTAVYITRKIAGKAQMLAGAERCLVFAENGIGFSEEIKKNHAVVYSENPQLAYAGLALQMEEMQKKEEALYKYRLHEDGYYVSENARIEAGAYIEPGCLIGHHVTLGRHAVILKGAVIRHTHAGEHFLANEYAVTGACGFTMADDGNGNKIRIPSLGGVKIGNNVEVGVHCNISRGSGGDTVLEDSVKLDAFVHIGHDARLMKNAEVTAGAVVGGFVGIQENAFIGINASVRNRIEIGRGAFVGMGAAVTKNTGPGMIVAGNPAKPLAKS